MYKLLVPILLAALPFSLHSQCAGVDDIYLGEDTIICAGSTLQLNAGPTYDFVSWSTGETTESIVVNASGTYIAIAGSVGANLVVNGDFQNGATGFNTQYTQGTGGTWGTLSSAATYDISTSPSLSHNNFMPCGDHTSGSGEMMVVNGSGTPNTEVWCQNIAVNPNTDYLFSAWITNALNDPNVAVLQFSINGAQLGNPFSTTPNGCDWLEFNEPWNSGITTSAEICIVNQNTTEGGNDFALDDISFNEICAVTDTIEVLIDPTQVDAGADLTFCPNETASLTATSNDPNAFFVWNGTSMGAEFSPTSSGYQTVSVLSANGCVIEDSALVEILPMDWGIEELHAEPTVCDMNNGLVWAEMNGSFNGAPFYNWSGPGTNSSNDIDASVFTDLSAGWYYFTVESGGCTLSDSIFVDQISPTANLFPNPGQGEAPLLVSFDNLSQNATDYFWDFGNGMFATSSDLSNQSSIYSEEGTYTVMLVATLGSCTDTAYTTVVVINPVMPGAISFPNVFTPNDDELNDVFTYNGFNLSTIEVVVVNRWGNVVFESNKLDFEWDGTINGSEANDGTYFYRYRATDLTDQLFEGHGFVQLLRN